MLLNGGQASFSPPWGLICLRLAPLEVGMVAVQDILLDAIDLRGGDGLIIDKVECFSLCGICIDGVSVS